MCNILCMHMMISSTEFQPSCSSLSTSLYNIWFQLHLLSTSMHLLDCHSIAAHSNCTFSDKLTGRWMKLTPCACVRVINLLIAATSGKLLHSHKLKPYHPHFLHFLIDCVVGIWLPVMPQARCTPNVTISSTAYLYTKL